MDTTEVADFLSPKVRVHAYLAFAIISAIIGAALAGCAATGLAAPVALIFASTFTTSLGTGLGLLAAANTHVSKAAHAA